MANDDNLRTLYDDEGMRTVTVKILDKFGARKSTQANAATLDECSSRLHLRWLPLIWEHQPSQRRTILTPAEESGLWGGH
jgi:hypothetical protein